MKEETISMDSLKEANAELTAELDEVKQQLLDARTTARENGTLLDEKDRLKRERMATMMAGFDLGGELFSDNERNIRKTIEHLDALQEGETIAPEDLNELRRRLLETQGIVRQAEASVTQKAEQEESALLRREALENQLATLQAEHEAYLQGKLSSEDVEEIKIRFANAHHGRQNTESERLSELSENLTRRTEDNRKLADEIEGLRQRIKTGAAVNGVANGAINGKTVEQQFAEFDTMKKSLMRDLQNRCERVIINFRFHYHAIANQFVLHQVVELEISLDETREQYNNVLRTSNNRAQQKKMAFLERNLEQLTVVQRQLVEQNSQLKKESAIAERKLATRTERIKNLESLLQDSQDKLTAANHRLVDPFLFLTGATLPLDYRQCVNQAHVDKNESGEIILNLHEEEDDDWILLSAQMQNQNQQANNATQKSSFEMQLQSVKERLEAAKAPESRNRSGEVAVEAANCTRR